MNRQFPAFRGLAILLVVINHSVTLGLAAAREAGLIVPSVEKIILIGLKEFGIVAVPIFLFLSACFFVYGAQGKTIRQGYSLVVPGLIHTIFPYLIWSLVYYLAVFLLNGEKYSLLGLAKNLLVGYPYNFVPILVFFYVLAPLLVWLARRYPLVMLAAFLIYQFFLIAALRPDITGFTLPGWTNFLVVPVLKLPLAIWGIFYPLGLVYGLHGSKITPWVKKTWWAFAAASFGLYVLALLTQISVIQVPLAEVLAPFFAIFLLLVVQRKAFPLVKFFETLSKRSYGLYLTNLLVLTLLIALVKTAFPAFLQLQPLLVPLLASITLTVPVWIMGLFERVPGRVVYRYVFG